MMISPQSFIKEFKNKSYKELLEERENLLRSIYEFEKNGVDNKLGDFIKPSPNVIYQVNLEYLGELCRLISEKFNEEYERG